MSRITPDIRRIDLPSVAKALVKVESAWPRINRRLVDSKVGGKEPPFNGLVRDNMMLAYRHIDGLLDSGEEPLSHLGSVLEINNLVLFGNEFRVRLEYNSSLQYSTKRFYSLAPALQDWYQKHVRKGDHPLKIAAEMYVSVVGHPQLFVEGNHRTGSLLSSWVNLYYGFPPFVLSEENALAYFKPSSEIKFFADKSTWRGQARLPKYRKSFRRLWETLIDERYRL